MGLMLLRTVLITVYGILAALTIIVDYFSKPVLGYITKPLLMPLLTVFYYYTACKLNIYIVFALIAAFITILFMLNQKKNFNKLIIIFFISLFNILFSIAVLKTNYYLEYIPVWFYLTLIPFTIIYILAFRKIYIKTAKTSIRLLIILYSISSIVLIFTIISRAWKYSSMSLCLPIIGLILMSFSSILFILNDYFKKIKNTDLLINTAGIYGVLILIMGVIPDW